MVETYGSSAATTELISGLRHVVDKYDAFILDQYGVM